jgi:hypothetical protein
MRTTLEHCNLVVLKEKIVDYLLSGTHPLGRHKAVYFKRLGFTADHWESFAGALKDHAKQNPIFEINVTPFGTKYAVKGPIRSRFKQSRDVISVWIEMEKSDTIVFVTAYPARG